MKWNVINERGAVSIFVVLLSAALITTISVSFMTFMLDDQRKTSADDLSQSAYDAALAGVEDAKRTLLAEKKACEKGIAECTKIRSAIQSKSCTTIQQAGVRGVGEQQGDDGIMIRQSEGDERLAQAYTCVTINDQPGDVRGVVATNQPIVMPLNGTSSFDQVEIQWFTKSDAGNVKDGQRIDNAPNASNLPLPQESDWPNTRPPLLRVQALQYEDGNIDLKRLNGTDAQTMFLYPVDTGNGTTLEHGFRGRKMKTGVLRAAACEEQFSAGDDIYACTARVQLPDPSGYSQDKRKAFIILGAMYRNTEYRLQLRNSLTQQTVPFKGIQAEVDATGRANDFFRRVLARVELESNSTFPYPRGAIDVRGDLCKNFQVTDNPGDYNDNPDGVATADVCKP